MKQTCLLKRTGVLSLIAIILFVLVPSAYAFDGRQGEKVIIGADEVIDDDLFVGADHFILNGTVKGDVYAGGTTVEINGVIEGDLIAAGQNLMINGTIKDDVRVAGMAVTVGERAILEDGLLFLGYSLETEVGSLIEQDLLFLGAQALLAGDIAQNATVFADGFTLLGSINGDVFAEIGSGDDLPEVSPFAFVPGAPSIPTIDGGLTVDPSASIGGDFKYSVLTPANVPASIVSGQVVENLRLIEDAAEVVEPANTVWAWFVMQVRYLVTLLILGGLVMWLAPKWVARIGLPVEEKPLHSLGWGFITLIAVGITFFAILAITILIAIGLGTVTLGSLAGLTITLGLFVFVTLAIVFGLTVAYLTKITVGYIGGRMLLERFLPAWAENRFAALALGLFLFVLISSIPFIGGWFNFAVVLLGLGALWLIGQRMYRQHYGQPAPADEPKGTIQPA